MRTMKLFLAVIAIAFVLTPNISSAKGVLDKIGEKAGEVVVGGAEAGAEVGVAAADEYFLGGYYGTIKGMPLAWVAGRTVGATFTIIGIVLLITSLMNPSMKRQKIWWPFAVLVPARILVAFIEHGMKDDMMVIAIASCILGILSFLIHVKFWKNFNLARLSGCLKEFLFSPTGELPAYVTGGGAGAGVLPQIPGFPGLPQLPPGAQLTPQQAQLMAILGITGGIPAATAPAVPSANLCRRCGQPMDGKFCDGCGASKTSRRIDPSKSRRNLFNR